MTAEETLERASEILRERGKYREDGIERSMARAAHAFNVLTGHGISEADGWLFMLLLKQSRAYMGAYNADDYLDTVGYAALLAECAERGQS